MVRLEGLSKLKKKIHLIGTRTRDLPACSIVPQPTTLPRPPILCESRNNILAKRKKPEFFDHVLNDVIYLSNVR
jgi:hypothetical protein